MISYIRGELSAIEEDKIIVDVNGIGYGILCRGNLWECSRRLARK